MKEAAGVCGGRGELWDLNRFSLPRGWCLATRIQFDSDAPDKGIGVSSQICQVGGEDQPFVFRDETHW